MDVGVGDDEPGPRLLVLHQADDSNIVLAEYAVEHVVCLLEVLPLHGHRTEFDELLFDQLVPDNEQAMSHDVDDSEVRTAYLLDL